MSLKEKLEAYRNQSHQKIPPEKLAIAQSATEDLVRSNHLANSIQPGDQLPDFALPNVHGKVVESQALLQKGPLVVSFYRGVW